MKRISILALIVLAAAAGCKKETEDPTTPTTCDVSNVTFKSTIKPIIDSRCATAGCHNAAASGGYDMTTYAGVKASAGRLIGAIKQQSGYSAMPQGGAKLTDCQIQQIETWVNAGTPDN